ncbi:Plasminogen activator inhibitor 1 RNA-binding protein [Myotis davidii]|uniref:Plasminogen activator inhibitor 1 RNA-binding protein n=1 Tax=Myotis davidii TaxID=225400 RepID=L5LTJ7_MYODS|nr:Plasminogen activator inhibitor 1 RNA-binding protein [Myotis davidii]
MHRRVTIMPGHLQESFGYCMVTNPFDQLFDDELNPFEALQAAENKNKEACGGLSEAMVVLEEVEDEVDVEWAEEMDLILVANMNLICIVTRTHRGSGSHNWGTAKDELTDLEQPNVTEEIPEVEEHPVANTENKENKVEEVKEEGPKEMTLDEWKAIQNKDRAKVEFNIRKPNEGADGQWKKGFVLHKSKGKEDYADGSVMDHHFRKPENDIMSQLEINFGDLGFPGHDGMGGQGGRGCAGLTSQVLLLLM